MKIASEVKIGISALIVMAVIFWGIRYLQGKSVFSSKKLYYAGYRHINGLETAAPVMLKGYKIGNVREIHFDPLDSVPFYVAMEIEKEYRIPSGSLAEIASADLLGSKVIRLTYSDNTGYHRGKDTLESGVVPDMLTGLMNDLSPLMSNVGTLATTLDSAGNLLKNILEDPAIRGSFDNIQQVTESLQEEFSPGGKLRNTISNLEEVSNAVKDQNASIVSVISNLDSVSRDIAGSDISQVISNLDSLTRQLNSISEQMASGKGSLGKLLYDDSLYMYITSLSADLDSLVIDLKQNPQKYVRFSVFGK